MRDQGIYTQPECRALVPLERVAGETRNARSAARPSSTFIAHLIATATQAPQTRAQRRAAPEEVTNRYRTAFARAPKATGRALAVTVK